MGPRPRQDRLRAMVDGTPSHSVAELTEVALRVLAAGAALAAVAAVAFAIVGRVGFPYPLEWMEGGLVLHVRRVLQGQPLYVEPSVSFTPFIYPPLFVYVAAGVAAVTGLGFLPLRLVSVGATLVCAAVVGLIVHRETGRWGPAMLAVGLFAATYPLSDTWFDLARVDMLFLALSLVALALLRFGEGGRAGVAAGVVVALAALTKQSTLLVFAPVGAALLVVDRRRGVAFAASAGTLILGATAALQVQSDGWFLYYVFFMPTGHEVVLDRLRSFWTVDLRPVVLAAVLAAGYFVAEYRRRPAVARFWALAAAGFVGAAWQARLHAGGWVNALLPAYAIVAILFGLGVGRALDGARQAADRVPRVSAPAIRVLVLVAVLAQFAVLGYAPGEHVPTAADRERGERLQRQLGALDEPAYSPVFPYLAVRAGHEPVAHKMALVDVLRAPPHDAGAALRTEIGRTMGTHRYGALAVHHREHALAPFTRAYRYAGRLGGYEPAAGVNVTPRYVFVPAPVDQPDDLGTNAHGNRLSVDAGPNATARRTFIDTTPNASAKRTTVHATPNAPARRTTVGSAPTVSARRPTRGATVRPTP